MEIGSEFSHLIANAVTDFKRNKIRTLLTSLGIMIGVLSVVMLIALGLGLKNYIQQQFENLGTNLIMVMPGSGSDEGGGLEAMMSGMFGGTEFDEKDAENLEKIPLLQYVVPVFFKSGIVRVKDDKEMGYLMGANTDVFKLLNLHLVKGEFFTEADVKRKSKNVVLGNTIAEDLFGTAENSVGATIEINEQKFEVVGAVEKVGDRDQDAAVFMPYTTTYATLNPRKKFFAIYLGVASKGDVVKAKKKVEEVMLKRYDEDEFSVTEQSEILGVINQIFGVLNAILVAIGSISLLVGGIGIMNIMYASVTERTKEVGIRRAIGATRKDILYQFLTESVALSLFGGILGLVLAIGIVLAIRIVFPAAINPLAVGIALLVSSAIGIFFGVFPARRAANLPPIEAIRYE